MGGVLGGDRDLVDVVTDRGKGGRPGARVTGCGLGDRDLLPVELHGHAGRGDAAEDGTGRLVAGLNRHGRRVASPDVVRDDGALQRRRGGVYHVQPQSQVD